MRFSIVIPTYNEQDVIVQTLTAISSSTNQDFEVIVVDDSSDNTGRLVNDFPLIEVRYIRPKVRQGRSEARNLGIRSSEGDVVVILNADVLMPKHFLERLAAHYDNGYDSVTAFVEVENYHNVYARFIELWTQLEKARGEYENRKIKDKGIYWSEGFSVRRQVLLQTNLFPVGNAVPIEAGEDVRLANELRDLGCKGIIDTDLTIKHIAPDTLHDFWVVRKGRGRGTPQIRRFVNGWGWSKIIAIITAKCAVRFLKIVTIVPVIAYGYRVSRYSKYGILSDLSKMSFLYCVELVAFSVGEFESAYEIFMIEKSG